MLLSFIIQYTSKAFSIISKLQQHTQKNQPYCSEYPKIIDYKIGSVHMTVKQLIN